MIDLEFKNLIFKDPRLTGKLLGFQSFFIMVIVGIYSVLVKQLQFSTSLNDLGATIGTIAVIRKAKANKAAVL